METKKISFGFSKITKKPNLLPPKQIVPEESKVELIKCLEGQEIKLVVEKPVEGPLIIPMKENENTRAALASLMKRRAVLLDEEEAPAEDEKAEEPETNKPSTNANESKEDLEKRAARELLEEIKGSAENTESTLVLPVVKPDDLPLDGAKESTLEDYESIPIQDFGMAMLRGMGFVEPAKKKGAPPADETPTVRPKGMGLGADKALKRHVPLIPPEKNEVLEIKKQAFVRILGGKHKDMYGQIEGFDDYAGRVIVKLAIGGAKEAYNEFLCQPVSKKEYAQYSKCINTAKYEEYKRRENENGQIVVQNEQIEERKIKVEKEEKTYFKEELSDIKREIKKERIYEEDRKYIKQEKLDKPELRDVERNERRREDDRRREDYKERHRDDYNERSRNENGKSYQQTTDRRDEKRRQDDYRERPRDDNGRSYQPSNDRRQHYYDERSDISKRRSPARQQQSRHTNAPSSSSNSRSRNRSATPERKQHSSTDDSASSDDSDSAYERKQKKCKHKSKSKHKSRKSKSKSSRQRREQSSDENDSSSDSDEDDERSNRNRHKRNSNKFKKKTKKSKRERSRSR